MLWLVFTVLALNCPLSGVGVLADHLLVISGSATTTYLYWLCRSPLPDKEGYFVLFTYCGFFYPLQCVCSFCLSFMTCTWWFQLILPSFGWHIIPVGHFLQKSLNKNSKIGFFLLPTARPCPLTHDPPLPILAGYRLVVPGSHACFTFFAFCSCICRDLKIGVYTFCHALLTSYSVGCFPICHSLSLASFGG